MYNYLYFISYVTESLSICLYPSRKPFFSSLSLTHSLYSHLIFFSAFHYIHTQIFFTFACHCRQRRAIHFHSQATRSTDAAAAMNFYRHSLATTSIFRLISPTAPDRFYTLAPECRIFERERMEKIVTDIKFFFFYRTSLLLTFCVQFLSDSNMR
jgi:hypothetical protein